MSGGARATRPSRHGMAFSPRARQRVLLCDYSSQYWGVAVRVSTSPTHDSRHCATFDCAYDIAIRLRPDLYPVRGKEWTQMSLPHTMAWPAIREAVVNGTCAAAVLNLTVFACGNSRLEHAWVFVCPSVRLSVRPSVRPSVCLSVLERGNSRLEHSIGIP